jgi:uncharacterized repeat protein (TIGR01451 family)
MKTSREAGTDAVLGRFTRAFTEGGIRAADKIHTFAGWLASPVPLLLVGLLSMGSPVLADITCTTTLSGEGTEQSPYLIANFADLEHFRGLSGADCRAAHYRQTAHITFEGAAWTRGSAGTFKGTYDGGGFRIDGLKIEGNTTGEGLFVSSEDATIKNLTIRDAEVTSTEANLSILVGNATRTTFLNITIENSSAAWTPGFTANSTGMSRVGAIASQADGGTFDGITINGTTLTGVFGVGAVAGTTITTDSPAVFRNITIGQGTQVNGTWIGGIVGGSNNPSLTFENILVAGSISGTGGSYVGGLLGFYGQGGSTPVRPTVLLSIRNIEITGTITAGAGGAGAGGLIALVTGTAPADVRDVTVSGTVSSLGDNVGGLFGFIQANVMSDIDNAAVTATIQGVNNVGGIMGQGGRVRIFDSSVTGDIAGMSLVGGIGGNAGLVEPVRVAVSGAISSRERLGGYFGNAGSVTIIAPTFTGSLTVAPGGFGDFVGGLAGSLSGTSIIQDAHIAVPISSSGWYIGGITGQITGVPTLRNLTVSAPVTGGRLVGGLAGVIQITDPGAVFEAVSISGDIVSTQGLNSTADAGGLFGLFNSGTPITLGSDLIVTGAVTATSTQVGGLLGRLNLFNAVHPFTFEGVSKTAGNVTGGGSVGGVVGRLVFTVASPLTLNNATVSASVTATGDRTGGLIGDAGSGGSLLISGSTVAGPLNGASDLGGFVGFRSGAGSLTIQNSTVSTDVRSTAHRVGGLIGSQSGTTPTLTGNTLANIVVEGVDHVGGWIGSASDFSIESWRPTGVSLEASGTGAGGLLGLATDMAITTSFSTMDVSGTNAVGGLVGVLAGNSTLTESYVSAPVSGTAGVGGLVGEVEDGTVEDTYAEGPVAGTSGVGGLVGLLGAAGEIKTSYAAGLVTGGANTGGLIGSNETAGASNVVDSFWDEQTTGQAASAGGSPKTTAEMKTLTTFQNAGWGIAPDPSAQPWTLCAERYPRLTWQGLGSVGVCDPPPPAPISLVATPGVSEVSISFVQPLDGGPPITNYEYSLDGGPWTAFIPAVPESPVVITGLTNGTTYSVRLRAVNEVGPSGPSDPVTAMPAAIPTGAAFTVEPEGEEEGRLGLGEAFEVEVEVRDAMGAVVVTETRDVTLTLTDATGAALPEAVQSALEGTRTRPAVAGVARFPGLQIQSAGTYTLTAQVGGITVVTEPFEVLPLEVTVTPVVGQTKGFGEADPVFAYTLTPALEGVEFTGGLEREAGEDLGSYAYTLGTLSAGPNYALSLASPAPTFEIVTTVPRGLGYVDRTERFGVGGAVDAPTLESTGGLLVTYEVAAPQPLPTGLELDAETGVLQWSAALATGVYEIEIEARNALGAERAQVVLTITPRSVEDLTIDPIAPRMYTSQPIEPELTVRFGETALALGVDYTVTYTNNVGVGTATATVRGEGNYGGTRPVTFEITPRPLTDLTIEPIDPQPYTGEVIEAEVVVRDEDRLLVLSVDYTVVYTNNVEVGTATAMVTGLGNYAGTRAISFEIVPTAPRGLAYTDRTERFGAGGALDAPTLESTGGIPVTYEVIAPATLPMGLELDAATGVIRWNPDLATGVYAIEISARNAVGAAEAQVVLTITPKPVEDLTVAPIGSRVYSGVGIEPLPVVRDGDRELVRGTDYTVAYTNNVVVGVASVTLTGRGNYGGSRTVTFDITPRPVADLRVEDVASQPYTGRAIEPSLVVRFGERALAVGVDYTVAYASNVEVGTATATLTGLGNYAGTRAVTFEIVPTAPRGLAYTDRTERFGVGGTLGAPSLESTGGAPVSYEVITPLPLPTGLELDAATGVVRWSAALATGVYAIEIQARNAVGAAETRVMLTITARSVADLTIEPIGPRMYTGEPIEPELEVRDGDRALALGVDYTVAYTNNVEVGTATVTVTGMGNYTGTRTLTFEITARPVTQLAIEALLARMYTGEPIEPELEVRDGDRVVTLGVDYTVTYANNVNVGMATVTLTGVGVYSGTVAETFEITPRPVALLEVDAIEPQRFTGGEIEPEVVVRHGERVLVQGVDYTVAYANNVAVGTATATLTGMGNYTGTRPVPFEIRPDVPGVPQDLAGTAGDTEVSLTWRAPERTGSGPITGYQVQIRRPGGAWEDALETRDLDAVVRGLENDRVYEFRVAARNEAGLGSYTDPGLPLIPTGPVLDDLGNTPEPELGEATEVVDGETRKLEIEVQDETRVVLRSTDFSLGIGATDAAGNPKRIASENAVVRLDPDGRVRTQGEGFQPGTVATVYMFSTPTVLGQLLIDEDGRFEGSLPMPDGIGLGRHTLQVTGVDQRGARRAASLGLLVEGEEQIQIAVRSSGTDVRVGETITLTVEVTNAGPLAALSVEVDAVLNDMRLRIVEASAERGEVDLEERVWRIGRMEGGERLTLTIVAEVRLPEGSETESGLNLATATAKDAATDAATAQSAAAPTTPTTTTTGEAR